MAKHVKAPRTGKKLFQVADRYFDDKVKAKEFRDSVEGKKTLRVSKGPDHFLFGVYGHERTHSSKRKTGRFLDR